MAARPFTLSPRQRATLARVVLELEATGQWARALHQGERVTLASLFRLGFLERRAWRGLEGQADAAHEYAPTALVLETWRARFPALAAGGQGPTRSRT
jgi:hypothetical protein